MRAALLFVSLMIIWLLWSGIFEFQLIFYGVISCALVLAITAYVGFLDRISESIFLLFRIVIYAPWMFWEILKANVAVAKIVLDPKLPIQPRLIEVRASQRTELGQVIYANSITLTPGTLSLDLRNAVILVHAIDAHSANGVESGVMDRRVSRLEGDIEQSAGTEDV